MCQSSHRKGKLLWYALPDYLATGTADTWAAEDGLHALAGHSLLQMTKNRIGKVHGGLDADSFERQPWAAELGGSLTARMKTFFNKKVTRMGSALQELEPAKARFQAFCSEHGLSSDTLKNM